VEAVLEEKVKLQETGFVKQVGFKPGVKERRVINVKSGESKVTGEDIGESEIEELVPK